MRVKDALKVGAPSLGPIQRTVFVDVLWLSKLQCPHTRVYRVIFINNAFFRLSKKLLFDEVRDFR